MNQQVVFLSDGGDTVRDLQNYLSPESEHLLDWFHITMRLTVMGQMLQGIRTELEPNGTCPETATALADLQKHLKSVKCTAMSCALCNGSKLLTIDWTC